MTGFVQCGSSAFGARLLQGAGGTFAAVSVPLGKGGQFALAGGMRADAARFLDTARLCAAGPGCLGR